MIIPHAGDGAASGAFALAYQFPVPWTAAQTGVHDGKLAAIDAPLHWEGEGIAFSSMKLAEDSGDLMLRWYNLQPEDGELSVYATGDFTRLYKSDVLERSGEDVTPSDRDEPLKVRLGKCEIYTLGVAATE
jgi:alpha-mannosidase